MNKLWTLLIIVVAVVAIVTYSRLQTPKQISESAIRREYAEGLANRQLTKKHSAAKAGSAFPAESSVPHAEVPRAKKSLPESKERIAEVLIELERRNQDMRWVMLTPDMLNILTPFGPCGSVTHLSPGQFGFNSGREDDRTILLFPSEEIALRAAWKYCDGWYTQEKSDRSAAKQTGQAWKQQAR